MKNKLLATALIFATASCASITGQGNQQVKIDTMPQGAEVIIDGQQHVSPAIVTLKGASGGYTVVAKKKGYRDSYAKVGSEVRILPAVVGNIFNLTGVIGMAVDFFATGAAYKLDNDVSLVMKKN